MESPSNVDAPPYGPPASIPPDVGAEPDEEVISVLPLDCEVNDRTPEFLGRYAGSSDSTRLYWSHARPDSESYANIVGAVVMSFRSRRFSFVTIPRDTSLETSIADASCPFNPDTADGNVCSRVVVWVDGFPPLLVAACGAIGTMAVPHAPNAITMASRTGITTFTISFRSPL